MLGLITSLLGTAGTLSLYKLLFSQALHIFNKQNLVNRIRPVLVVLTWLITTLGSVEFLIYLIPSDSISMSLEISQNDSPNLQHYYLSTTSHQAGLQQLARLINLQLAELPAERPVTVAAKDTNSKKIERTTAPQYSTFAVFKGPEEKQNKQLEQEETRYIYTLTSKHLQTQGPSLAQNLHDYKIEMMPL